jgi:hypothetical protein
MLNILGHKGNENENDIEIPPQPSQNGYDTPISQITKKCW